MGFYRLIYRIGRMIFRDFLFKIPKKYLVIIIVFLSMFIFKANVFAYSLGSEPIKNLDVITERVKYSDIIEFYEYFPLFDGVWASNEYINNGSVYALSTRIYPFNDENNSVWLKGQMFFPRYSENIYQNGIILAGYDATYGTSLSNWGWVLACDTAGWLKSIQWLQGSSYSVSMPILLVPQTVVSFDFTGYSNGNISGRINNSVFSNTYTEPNGYTSYLYNRFPIRLNYGPKTNGQVRVQSLIFKDTDGNITHALYPAKANILGVATYGLYDTYGGDFYSLSGVEFNKTNTGSVGAFNSASFGNVLTGSDIPPNMNNFDVSPYITNENNNIINWSFDTLNINGGSILNVDHNIENKFYLIQYYNDKQIILPIDNYKTVVYDRFVTFSIPRNVLLNDSAVINGYSVRFDLRTQQNIPYGTTTDYYLNTYTLSLTQTEQDNINEDKTQQSLDNISQQQEQTTNAINDMSDIITNDNISSSVIDQPDVPTDTSGVENGVNNIFTVIMNAFTNFNSSQDVVLPIPFTNKNITISGNYTRDMLTSANASWVINFITIFWWYIISVYIVKDVLKTVDKIQEGKIDSVENTNIKGDML